MIKPFLMSLCNLVQNINKKNPLREEGRGFFGS